MRRCFKPLVVVTGCLLATACNFEATDIGELEESLNQNFGGLTEAGEDPMFDEESVYDDLNEADGDPTEDTSGDTIAEDIATETDAALGTIEENVLINQPIVYGVRIVWGRRTFDASVDTLTTWNPTISATCGALGVRHRIRMEAGERVVRWRTDRQSISLISSTAPHFDGVALALVIPSTDNTCIGALSFSSDGLQDALPPFPIDDTLKNQGAVYDVGDGNIVAVFVHKVEPSRNGACVRGHLTGRWRRAIDADGNVRNIGRFYGRVVNELGDMIGHTRGIYGVPTQGLFEGKQVFYGKLINSDGTFVGLMAGRYDNGRFGGGWHLRPRLGDLEGFVGGHYRKPPDSEPDGGYFRARYASNGCFNQLEEQALGQ